MNVAGVTTGANEQYPLSPGGGIASAGEGKAAGRSLSGLTDEERRQTDKLKAQDTEVRAHESAHVAAGGQYVRGGPTYEYQTGPDGKKYAVGGEVSIDTSPVKGDPQATIAKMETVKRAALAPAQPSGQDQAVAAQAAAAEAQAQQELAAQKGSGGFTASGAKGAPGSMKSEGKPQPLFPKASESAYIRHSAISNKNSARAVQSAVDLMA